MGKRRRSEAESRDDTLDSLIDSLIKETASGSTQDRVKNREKKRQRRWGRHEQALASRPRGRDDRNISKEKSDINAVSSVHKKNLKSLVKLFRELSQRPTAGRRRPFEPQYAKSVRHRKQRWDGESIQPRANDYGGIGLARPSLFLALDDPGFFPKLEEEYAVHVPGFFGKQKTKAMKKQLSSKMLWKRMSLKKDMKVNGKKLSALSPDERVEAMLQARML